MKSSKLIPFLVFCIKTRRVVLVTGQAGGGKTDNILQAVAFVDAEDRNAHKANKNDKRTADEVGCDVIISHPVVSDPTDFKGLPMPSKDGLTANFLPFGDLQRLMTAKRLTVFFIDDLGQASPAVQASIMQLLLAREINGKKISDNVVFMMATNRKQDKAGVVGILEPVKSRCDAIVEYDIDSNDWINWAFDHNMPIELIAYVQLKPTVLTEGKPSNDIVNTPCPRTIAKAGKFLTDGLPEEFQSEAFEGACGKGFAIEFSSFLKLVKEMPSLDEVINNPDNVAIPAKLDIQYALCGALVNAVNAVKMPNVVKFMSRLPEEFQMFTQKAIACAKPKLTKEYSYMQWSAKLASSLVD